MGTVIKFILTILITSNLLGCRTGFEPDEVLIQKVEITNNSSSNVFVESSYGSNYSSSTCTLVDSLSKDLAPGESVSKQLKMDCYDSWTAGFTLYFRDSDGNLILYDKIIYEKEICDSGDEETEYPNKGTARFVCDDDGCKYLCVKL